MAAASDETSAFAAFENAAHSRLAASYLLHFSPVSERAIGPLLDAAEVGSGTRLLEVASGPGRLTGRATQRGASATGIDVSAEMIALARRAYPDLDFREGSAEALPFASSEFDAVVSAFGLGHFSEPERAVTEMVRVLKPGGRLALSWWQSLSRNRINGIFFDVIQQLQINTASILPPGPPIDRFSSSGALTGLLSSAGITPVRIESSESIHQLRTVDDLWQLAMGSFARVSTVVLAQSHEVQQRIRKAVEEQAEPYRTADGLAIPIAFYIASGNRAA